MHSRSGETVHYEHEDRMIRVPMDDHVGQLLVLAENFRILQGHPVGQHIPLLDGRTAVKVGEGPDGVWEADGETLNAAQVSVRFNPKT